MNAMEQALCKLDDMGGYSFNQLMMEAYQAAASASQMHVMHAIFRHYCQEWNTVVRKTKYSAREVLGQFKRRTRSVAFSQCDAHTDIPREAAETALRHYVAVCEQSWKKPAGWEIKRFKRYFRPLWYADGFNFHILMPKLANMGACIRAVLTDESLNFEESTLEQVAINIANEILSLLSQLSSDFKPRAGDLSKHQHIEAIVHALCTDRITGVCDQSLQHRLNTILGLE